MVFWGTGFSNVGTLSWTPYQRVVNAADWGDEECCRLTCGLEVVLVGRNNTKKLVNGIGCIILDNLHQGGDEHVRDGRHVIIVGFADDCGEGVTHILESEVRHLVIIKRESRQ